MDSHFDFGIRIFDFSLLFVFSGAQEGIRRFGFGKDKPQIEILRPEFILRK
jgi:hypothetical protein